MSNLPFRIAFWALCCALTLIVVTVVSIPAGSRFASRAGQSTSSEDETQQADPPSEPPAPPGDRRPTRPVQIASLNPRGSLGIDASNSPPLAKAQPACTDVCIAAAIPEGNERSILVPIPAIDPHFPTTTDEPEGKTDSRNSTTELAGGLSAPVSSALDEDPTREWLQSEVEQLRREVDRLQLARNDGPEADPHQDRFRLAVDPESSYTASEDLPEGVLLSAAETVGRFNFRFRSASLPDLLQLLGSYAGWNVMVDPRLRGECTGEFANEEPGQVLVLLVKSHGCTITRRGNTLLIGHRVD